MASLDPLSNLHVEGEPQSFTVELTDAEGNVSAVIVSPIPYPAGERQPNDFFDGGSFTGHVHMGTFRIQLDEFAAVDLSKVTDVALLFDKTQTGALFIADMELVSGVYE